MDEKQVLNVKKDEKCEKSNVVNNSLNDDSRRHGFERRWSKFDLNASNKRPGNSTMEEDYCPDSFKKHYFRSKMFGSGTNSRLSDAGAATDWNDEKDRMQWDETEKAFHLKQMALKAQLHIKEGRASCFDKLLANTNPITGYKSLEDPFQLVQSKIISHNSMDTNFQISAEHNFHENYINDNPDESLDDLESLVCEIISLETRNDLNKRYWNAVLDVIRYFGKKINEQHGNCKEVDPELDFDTTDFERVANAVEEGVESKEFLLDVKEEILSLFKGKSFKDLQNLRLQVEDRLSNASQIGDEEFWLEVLAALKEYILMQNLKECHQLLLTRIECSKRNFDLLDLEIEQSKAWQERREREEAERIMRSKLFQSDGLDQNPLAINLYLKHQTRIDNYVSIKQFYPLTDEQVLSNAELKSKLIKRRITIAQFMVNSKSTDLPTLTRLSGQESINSGVDQSSKNFSEQMILPRSCCWAQMGVEWTRYNRAHYNYDNPPPRTPKAYLFHVFFPSRTDLKELPSFKILPDEGIVDPITSVPQRCIIILGPSPYKPLIFLLDAEKDWELGHKHGFKCHFDQETLKISFRLRRPFIRR